MEYNWGATFDGLLSTAAQYWQNQQQIDARLAEAEILATVENAQNVNAGTQAETVAGSDNMLYLIAGGIALVAVLLIVKGR